MKNIALYINGKKIKTQAGKKLLEVARENKIEIPSLCHHPDLKTKANCRLCLIKIKGNKKLVPSCATHAQEGMEITTETPQISRLRKINLKLLMAEHLKKCPTCVYRLDCKLLELAQKYKVNTSPFNSRKENRKTYKAKNAVEWDNSQCIDCRNCLEVCGLQQNIGYLKLEGKGINQEIKPQKQNFLKKLTKAQEKVDCIYCGQCALHCPVSAAQEQIQTNEVEEALRDPEKIVIAQFAPSIRVSIGEEFGLKAGTVVTKKLTAGLKKLGFDYIFDVNFGADITTMVEAQELLDRIKNKKTLPLMTSCCPGWVKYVETYHPEIIPNLTTSRSPHIHLGGAIKTYWAKKYNIDPENIVVVSIMPCTAKKFEASRKEMKINGLYPVDNVLTTRETAWLLNKNKLNLKNISAVKEVDKIFTEHSGAGAIYGGSGGVMESALRTAQYLANKKQSRLKINFKEVRGLENIKEAEITINKKKLKIAVVNGIGNVEPIIKNLKKYHYIEVMTCPGGCIGGGGQPIPTNKKIREERLKGLYKIDEQKKIRQAHKNKQVQEILTWAEKKKKSHKLLHTKYSKK